MENENVVLCPVHGGSLCISPKIITFLGTHYNALEGKCPQCRVVYLDQKIKGIARFTYEGTNYQYLPELENWRVKQEQKKEEERKKKERQKEQMRKYPFLSIKKIKIRVRPSKYRRCPEHGLKVEKLTFTLRDNSGVNLETLTGGYCSECNAIYLNQLLRQSLLSYVNNEKNEYFIMMCGEDWKQTPPISVSKIQVPVEKKQEKRSEKNIENKNESVQQIIERKQVENENPFQPFREEQFTNYIFLKTRKIKLKTVQRNPNRCSIHQEQLEVMHWRLEEEGKGWRVDFNGFYCAKCNCVYQKKSVEEQFASYIVETKRAKFFLTPRGKKWKKAYPIEVSELELFTIAKRSADAGLEMFERKPVPTKKYDNTDFKLTAYQKYEKEIAEIAATVNDESRLIRILTTVNENDKRKCVPEDMLIRESESTGRELLGRIAHDQLGEFTSKYGTIKIHNYKVWPGQEHHLDGFTRFCDPENIQNITIMSQNNLSRESDEYEMVTALVYCANRVEPVYIDVYYSKRQNKYFINEESYRQYRLRYGLPYVHLVADEYDGDMDYGNLRKNSELNLYGYTVAKTAEMSTGERQRLLQQLMDNGLMSKHQIVNHLEWLIHRQSGRVKMEDACDCWREDLRFVNSYRLNAQRKIQGRFVYGKTVLR